MRWKYPPRARKRGKNSHQCAYFTDRLHHAPHQSANDDVCHKQSGGTSIRKSRPDANENTWRSERTIQLFAAPTDTNSRPETDEGDVPALESPS